MTTLTFWGLSPSPTPAELDAAIETLKSRYLALTRPSLYASEDGREFLEGLYRTFARSDLEIAKVFNRLLSAKDPLACDDEFVSELATVVGLDERTPWFASLTANQRRRFVVSAPFIFDEKGTDYRRFFRALLGARSVTYQWQDLRDIVGGPLPALFVALSDAGEESTVYVHHTNPEGVSATIINAAVETVRRLGSTVIRQVFEFIDDFLEGSGQWTTSGPVTAADGVATVGDGVDTAYAETANDGSTWAQHAVHVRARYRAGDAVRLRTYMDATDDGFELLIEPAGVASQIRLYNTVGPALLMDSGAVLDIPAGYTVDLRVEHRAVAGGTRVLVILDGSTVFEYVPGAVGYLPGRFRLSADAGSVAEIVLAEVVEVA